MTFSLHDSVSTSPTNVFATWNVLDTTATVSDGNLKVMTGNVKTFSTIFLPKSAGKFYAEYYIESMGYPQFGIYNHDKGTRTLYQSTNQPNESILLKNVNTATTFQVSNGDIVSVLVDTTNETIQWFKNGGSTSSNASSSYTLDDLADNDYSFYMQHGSGAGTSTIRANFGQDHLFGGATLPSGAGSNTPDNGIGTFAFSVPSGAKALSKSNLPDPAIDPAVDDLPEDYFKAVTYTGQTVGDAMTAWDGTTGTVNVGFQPDLVWIKSRTAGNHSLIDSIRGATYGLHSDTTQAQWTDPTTLTALNSNGFSLGTHTVLNGSGNYIAWCFRAGGAPTADNTATSGAMTANSVSVDGSLQSSYTPSGSPTIYPKRMSIGAKQGFSIVKYVGAGTTNSRTIPHGLSSTPDLIIIKDLDGSNDWITWFKGFGAGSYLRLNTSDSKSTVSNAWGGSPTNNTFNVYQSGAHNTSGNDYIAYCWHSVPGYSKFDSYTGNGSATSGPFIFTGFKPALIWIKCTSDSTTTHTSWSIYDNAREPNNVMNKPLYANKSAAEGERGNGTTDATDIKIDFLSNGFRILTDKEELNDDGETYIFCCWAEMPQKFAVAR